jgi:hypothetical protein
MKFTFKLLLLLSLVIAAIYAATPLWLPHIFSKQLPQGWQLQAMDTGYPDTSGIHIHSLQVKGELQAAELTLSAKDIHFNIFEFKTRINSVSLDVFMRAPNNVNTDAIRLNDLSLPSMKLTGRMPELSLEQLRLSLHQQKPLDSIARPPLVLEFDTFSIVPDSDNSFHITTRVGFDALPVAPGQLELTLNTESLKASVQFPAGKEFPKWLVLDAEQWFQGTKKTTRMNVSFDADVANREWLSSILSRGSSGLITQADGKLEAQADFAGPALQHIETLTIGTEDLHLLTDSGSVSLQANLLASREQENVIASLADSASIKFQDDAGRIDELLKRVFPEFQRDARSDVQTTLEFQPGASFKITPAETLAIHFSGGFLFRMDSSKETFSLKSNDSSIWMAEFPKLDTITTDGSFLINWNEDTASSYASPAGDVSAESFSISAEILSNDNALLSNGQASVVRGEIAELATSADQIDLQWQEFDLLNLSGNLASQTRGFANLLNDERWTGFDLSVNYQLIDGERVSGSGHLLFENGSQLPIEYSGNATTDEWNIKLPSTAVKLAQLGDLLNVAHIDLPSSMKLINGDLNLQGDVIVSHDMKATLLIEGDKFDASMKESFANDVSFSLNTMFDDQMSVDGPLSIGLISLAGGIEVSQLTARLKMENSNQFGLQKLRADLFDGQLLLENLWFSNNRIEDTQVELSHINLGRLLEFTDVDGLQGSGFLDISLPVSQDQTGISIKNGHFRATGPGRIAYSREGLTASNIGLQALENFHFKDLSGTINYQADGQYQVTVRLEGNNPDLYDGYPVAFNLTINGSLPELFEALFITGDFEDAILKEIKSQ